MEYKPASLVDAGYCTPVSLFAAETLAPATTAPSGSVTIPRITPVFVCAYSTTGSTSQNANLEPAVQHHRLAIHYDRLMSRIPRRRFLTAAGATAALQRAAVAQPRPRNVLLLIADDLGCFLPSYGDPNAVMPVIERTAAEGVRFSNAYCTTASCSASRSVVLSGLYNHANGQYGHAQTEHHFSYLPEIVPFTRLLKNSGYKTGYIAKLHVAPEDRFGWDLADPMGSRDVWRMAQTARKFIQTAGSKPWYLHCGFHDPHRAGDGFANQPWPNVKRLRLDAARIAVPAWLP